MSLIPHAESGAFRINIDLILKFGNKKSLLEFFFGYLYITKQNAKLIASSDRDRSGDKASETAEDGNKE